MVIERWTLKTLSEKLLKVGAKVIAHAHHTNFQIAEIAVHRNLFQEILRRIDGLRRPAPAVV